MADMYSIKPGYVTQEANHTITTDEAPYWTKNRIRMSKYYQYAVYQYARQLILQQDIKSVIDVGCGVGTKLFELIAPLCTNLTGVDHPEAIRHCENHRLGRFFVDNLETPNFSLYTTYGLVICADVIEHLLDPDPLIELIKCISTKDTWIVISTPERDKLRGTDCMRSPKREHVREWNTQEFRAYLESHNLNIVSQSTVLHVKPNLIDRTIRNEYWDLLKNGRGLRTQQLIVAKYPENITCAG